MFFFVANYVLDTVMSFDTSWSCFTNTPTPQSALFGPQIFPVSIYLNLDKRKDHIHVSMLYVSYKMCCTLKKDFSVKMFSSVETFELMIQ